jgi:hypothetical protein
MPGFEFLLGVFIGISATVCALIAMAGAAIVMAGAADRSPH